MPNEFEPPKSRIEAILQNMLGAENVLQPPQSRVEYYLMKILEEGLGSEVVANPTLVGDEDPLTSLEVNGTKFKVPEVEANPTVPSGVTPTSLDKIKIGNSYYNVEELFIISATGGTSDKTNAEIIDALNRHKLLIVAYSSTKYTLERIVDEGNNKYSLFFGSTGNNQLIGIINTQEYILVDGGNPTAKPTVGNSTINMPLVSANPAIPSGTTPTALENLKIGSGYFSIPGGQHLYAHNIYFNMTTAGSGSCTIISTSATPYDTASFKSYILANFAESVNTSLPATGYYKSGSTIDMFIGICALSNKFYLTHAVRPTDGTETGFILLASNLEPIVGEDAVVQIF